MPSGRPDYSVTVYGTVAISGGVVITGVVSILGTVTVTGAVTVTGTVAISGTVTVTGAVTVTGTVSITGTVTITGAVTVTGSVTVSGTVAISGTVTVSGAVTVTGSVTVSGTVAVSGTVTITGAVTVTGSVSITGTVTITGAVTVTGSVTVSGTVAISGTVTISGSVSITGTVTISGAVTITSGAVTISTSGGTNILIDKLIQGAYTDNQRTLSNAGDPVLYGTQTGANRDGKYFPRGCRGWLERVDIYCKSNGGGGGTITVYIAPQPGMGYVASAVATIANGFGPGSVQAVFNRAWNYDSLFIFVVCSNADVPFSYNNDAPFDRYYSADSGATWAFYSNRNNFSAVFDGQTVGDLPVSGTVNNVPIPSAAAESYGDAVACAGSAETTVLTIAGAGKCSYIAYFIYTAAACDSAKLKVYCDGVLAWSGYPLGMSLWGHTASTPGASLLKWAAATSSSILLTITFEFRRELKIAVLATTATAQSVDIRATPNLIK